MTSPETDFRRHDTTSTAAHEHSWCVESRHTTSTGEVLYVRCGECGTRRVDVQEHGFLPPAAASKELRSPSGPTACTIVQGVH